MILRWDNPFLFCHIVQQLTPKPCVHYCCKKIDIGWDTILTNILFLLDSFTENLFNVPLHASIKMVNSWWFIQTSNYLCICTSVLTFILPLLHICNILLFIICIVIIQLILWTVTIHDDTVNFSDNSSKLS